MDEYILPERKAFVNWFNNEFYKKIVDRRKGKDLTKKIYQEMLRDYLNTEAPYRGTLVYHGLGTGKTATAITATEGLRSDWEIITILPPSLESNFVEEIKRFGDPLFRILLDSVNKWVYVEKEDMPVELKEFTAQYRLTDRFMTDRAKELQREYGISNSHTIADEDGVGGGVVDFLYCKGFVNGSRPLKELIGDTYIVPNYNNLKSQCGYKMAEKIIKREVGELCSDSTVKGITSEEMEQVKQKDIDKDGKIALVSKDVVKQMIGRSPDEWDSIMMRYWFELTPKLIVL
jgi:hypothetical protein